MTRKISLRYKLLILLILLPLVSLSIYLFMASKLFIDDKRAYIFDSALSTSRSLATQIKMELKSYIRMAEPIIENIDPSSGKFTQYAETLFNAQKSIDYLLLYKKSSSSGVFILADQLNANGREIRELKLDPALLNTLQEIVARTGVVITEYPHHSRYFMIMQSHGDPKATDYLVTLAIYKSQELFEAFATPTFFKSYLISKSKFFAMKPKIVSSTDRIKINDFDFFKPIINQKLPEGTAEITTDNGFPTLVSFSDVGYGDLLVATVIDKKAAFKTIENLIIRSLLFFISIISITLVISIFSSLRLTSALSDLLKATEQIGNGDFSIEFKIFTNDEMGDLSRRFMSMAKKVSNLLDSTAEKARMESELETVRTVQNTLFPKAELGNQYFKIVSYFEPASECAGDWFHYSLINDKVYMWIGDATGHGAPAALVTSAAKSASALIETQPELTASKAMELLNHAIQSTTKGEVLMTFFVGVLDLKTGLLHYSNASHESPYVIPRKPNLKRNELIPLCENNGLRLGESAGSKYYESTYKLASGDTIFFYTDGLMDIKNPQNETLGERNFLKKLIDASNNSGFLGAKVENLKTSIKSFQKDAPPIDDITFFWMEFNSQSQNETI